MRGHCPNSNDLVTFSGESRRYLWLNNIGDVKYGGATYRIWGRCTDKNLRMAQRNGNSEEMPVSEPCYAQLNLAKLQKFRIITVNWSEIQSN